MRVPFELHFADVFRLPHGVRKFCPQSFRENQRQHARDNAHGAEEDERQRGHYLRLDANETRAIRAISETVAFHGETRTRRDEILPVQDYKNLTRKEQGKTRPAYSVNIPRVYSGNNYNPGI